MKLSFASTIIYIASRQTNNGSKIRFCEVIINITASVFDFIILFCITNKLSLGRLKLFSPTLVNANNELTDSPSLSGFISRKTGKIG